MYKQSKKRFDEDPEFKERARKAVTQLQGGDAQFITAWERICEASRKVYNDYKQLLSATLASLLCCTALASAFCPQAITVNPKCMCLEQP